MKKIYLLSILFVLIFSYGCGNNDKLNDYYSGMQSFTSNVQIITEELEMVDISKEASPKQINALLERLLEQFKIMSELEVPKTFATNEELADDAYNYMNEAVSLFKEFTTDFEDDDKLRMAKENYERAMTRVNYMSVILQGKLPEGDNISTYEEDATDFAPVIDDSSADDSIENENYDVDEEADSYEEYEEPSEEDEFSYDE